MTSVNPQETDKRRPGRESLAAPDQLIVARPHVNLVISAIAELGLPIQVTEEENSGPLGLQLVAVNGFADGQVTGQLDAEYQKRVASMQQPGLRPAGGSPRTDLEKLLFCIRHDFAGRYRGWSPEMGRNRHVESITGLPHLSGTGPATKFPEPSPDGPLRVAGVLRRERTGRDVVVGLLDTPLFNHPDLTGRFVADEGDILSSGPPYPHWAGHATFTAGLILRQGPAVALNMRAVLNSDTATGTAWDVAKRMVEFRGTGVKVLCVPLGGFTEDGQPPLVLSRAVELISPEILVVAAAGNHGELEPPAGRSHPSPKSAMFPAALDGVISVGGLDDNNQVTSFTPKVPWVRFLARAEDVSSTYLVGDVDIQHHDNERLGLHDGHTGQTTFTKYAKWSGNSFAAGLVAGRLAALTADNGGDPWDALKTFEEQLGGAFRRADLR
ncbi:S8/S53 family peptidase [Dactylosporangium sp. NPDC049525]|uniref:S8 family peptidase n=1 Tax=Dactylosporangium sp. NPDC049525 TaxID=3154730 RepID=UPI00341562D7